MRLLFLCNCCANWTVAQKRKRDGRLVWLFRNNLILSIFQSSTREKKNTLKIHLKSYTNTCKPLQSLSSSADRYPLVVISQMFWCVLRKEVIANN